ncbi:MAG: saccharopine dehydrogenase NADP-binding domain-containing protein [Saprospiraceae bacterium]|nr:saccharopine dehydrogenase NADP-binding domain-containing protein [Saprospiraceae bacterium]
MKKYDIVLFGATGFTGKIVAQYLSQFASDEHIRWAIAGRERNKLVQLSSTLKNAIPDIIIADVNDELSLKDMASQAVLIMNTVGPFNWYGKSVLDACIQQKANYIDITGEPYFIHKTYTDYNELAQKQNITIINCCGFDSIPADLVAWMTAKKLPVNEPKVLYAFVDTNATFSGGTITTAIDALYQSSNKKYDIPKSKKHKDAPKASLKIHFNKDINKWVIPMPVADPHIVRRSIEKMPEIYGEAVTYRQYLVRDSFYQVLKIVVPVFITMLLIRFDFYRNWLLKKFKSGSGPSEERRSKSKFDITCIGKSTNHEAKSVMSGADPGYNETAKMFSEAGFSLIEKSRNNSLKHGVCTPMEALGANLIDRLKNKDINIS